MPQEILIMIFVLTWGAIGVGFAFDIKTARELGALKIQFQTLVNLLGEKVARILHSPHTPELDALLEKVGEVGGMSTEEKEALAKMLHDIENNVGGERTKGERLQAALLDALLRIEDIRNGKK